MSDDKGADLMSFAGVVNTGSNCKYSWWLNIDAMHLWPCNFHAIGLYVTDCAPSAFTALIKAVLLLQCLNSFADLF